MSDQSQNGVKCLYKESGENVVKSILYACTISCMAGPMVEMMNHASCHKFQLTIGFMWFLFYSAYLFDDIRTGLQHDLNSPCLRLDLLGWICFMIQGATIGCSATAIESIVFGCIGLGFVNLSLSMNKDNQECHGKWMAENGVMLMLMIALLIGHWLEHGPCKDYQLVDGLVWTWVVLGLSVLLFFYKMGVPSIYDIRKIFSLYVRSLGNGGKLLCKSLLLLFTKKNYNAHQERKRS